MDEGLAPDFDQPIRLRDVWMSYDGRSHVLKGIDLAIEPRQTIAFVGASGAGKSTLVTLLTGILRPSRGQMSIGDVDYRELNLGLLRRSIGYVTQETVVFNDTIRNNITLSDDNVPNEKVMAAVNMAYLAEFVEGLPDGYDTIMGDSGINVSGGQRQRISIARELFKDVELLIFDEATSSLDTHSEQEIQRNVDEMRGEKTLVIIAHRLSTVKSADTIVVLSDGEVVEQGSYEELYALGGVFKAMVDEQALSESQPVEARA